MRVPPEYLSRMSARLRPEPPPPPPPEPAIDAGPPRQQHVTVSAPIRPEELQSSRPALQRSCTQCGTVFPVPIHQFRREKNGRISWSTAYSLRTTCSQACVAVASRAR